MITGANSEKYLEIYDADKIIDFGYIQGFCRVICIDEVEFLSDITHFVDSCIWKIDYKLRDIVEENKSKYLGKDIAKNSEKIRVEIVKAIKKSKIHKDYILNIEEPITYLNRKSAMYTKMDIIIEGEEERYSYRPFVYIDNTFDVQMEEKLEELIDEQEVAHIDFWTIQNKEENEEIRLILDGNYNLYISESGRFYTPEGKLGDNAAQMWNNILSEKIDQIKL
ncbi:MAG: hypothetical protein ACRCWG_16955 [Sarcina sp.]